MKLDHLYGILFSRMVLFLEAQIGLFTLKILFLNVVNYFKAVKMHLGQFFQKIYAETIDSTRGFFFFF